MRAEADAEAKALAEKVLADLVSVAAAAAALLNLPALASSQQQQPAARARGRVLDCADPPSALEVGPAVASPFSPRHNESPMRAGGAAASGDGSAGGEAGGAGVGISAGAGAAGWGRCAPAAGGAAAHTADPHSTGAQPGGPPAGPASVLPLAPRSAKTDVKSDVDVDSFLMKNFTDFSGSLKKTTGGSADVSRSSSGGGGPPSFAPMGNAPMGHFPAPTPAPGGGGGGEGIRIGGGVAPPGAMSYAASWVSPFDPFHTVVRAVDVGSSAFVPTAASPFSAAPHVYRPG